MDNIKEVAERFVQNKLECDDLKKLVDRDNKKLKELMAQDEMLEFVVNNYTLTRSISNRETLDEEKLLSILKQHESDIPSGIIKVKEYVDTDALEHEIYNDNISKDILGELDACVTTKQVETLRLTKTKKKGDTENE